MNRTVMMAGAVALGTIALMTGAALAGEEFTRMAVEVSELPKEKAFLEEIVLSRAKERTAFSAKGKELVVAFRLDPKLEGEKYRIEVKDGKAQVSAGRFRGLLYGAGTLLRSIEWCPEAFVIAEGVSEKCPEKPIRYAYWARHFYNWYHMASAEELKRYAEDLALWGINGFAFQFAYPIVDLERAKGDDRKRFVKVSREVTDALERMDLGFSASGGGNQAPHNTDPKLKAAPNSDPKRGNFGFNVCPAKPGGLEFLLAQQRRGLDLYEGVAIDMFCHWPFDEGGCDCEVCRPWGGNGYLKLCKEHAKRNIARRPEAKTCLSTWTFHDDEFRMLYDYLATEDSKWIDILLIDSHTDFPKYPLEHRVPRNVPIITFPEISMWGREPWGGFGAIAMPARFERLFRQCEKAVSGFRYYSEGLSEDINKAVVTRLYCEPELHWQEIVKEYCRWELPGVDPEAFIELVTHLENTHAIPDFGKKTVAAPAVGRGDAPALGDFETRCRYCLDEAVKAEALSAKIDAALSPSVRSCWRWRQLRLRTIIDREIFTARKWNTPVADEAYRELVKMYHADRSYGCVRPPVR